MNRDKLERWILLRQSGELGRWRGYLLDRALARDPELRRFAEDSTRLMSAVHAWTVRQPNLHTAEAIHARIHAAPDRRDEIVVQPAPVFRLWPALAGATALLAVVALIALRSPEKKDGIVRDTSTTDALSAELAWDDHVDAELDALMELVSITGTDDSALSATTDQDEESLIREWLALEGITI